VSSWGGSTTALTVPSKRLQRNVMRFSEDQWVGNQWASIDIEPVDAELFLPILKFLADTYDFPIPTIDWDVDGYSADFEILGSQAIIKVDSWTFSIAFQKTSVRDQLLAVFRSSHFT